MPGSRLGGMEAGSYKHSIVVLPRPFGVKFIQDGGIICALRGRHDGGIIYALR